MTSELSRGVESAYPPISNLEGKLMDFSLPDEAFQDFSAVLQIEPRALLEYEKVLAAQPGTLISAQDLQNLARQVLPRDSRVGALFRQLFLVNQLSDAGGGTVSAVVDSIYEALALRAKRPPESRPIEILSAVVRLAADRHIRASTKALSLAFASDHIYQNSVIVTDIRPVFSDSPSEVVGFISIQDLHLDFYRSGRRHHLVLAVDRDDIRELRSACDRALSKIETSLSLVEEKFGVKAVVAGEDRIGFED
jgi:hypothetical protein